jgi:hypothetical protein
MATRYLRRRNTPVPSLHRQSSAPAAPIALHVGIHAVVRPYGAGEYEDPVGAQEATVVGHFTQG